MARQTVKPAWLRRANAGRKHPQSEPFVPGKLIFFEICCCITQHVSLVTTLSFGKARPGNRSDDDIQVAQEAVTSPVTREVAGSSPAAVVDRVAQR
jgi:hypothetical protein